VLCCTQQCFCCAWLCYSCTFGCALLCCTAALNPPEAEVYTYAVQYITVRSWGILAAMLGFVASGTYRQAHRRCGRGQLTNRKLDKLHACTKNEQCSAVIVGCRAGRCSDRDIKEMVDSRNVLAV
jgi:hypothetical protein